MDEPMRITRPGDADADERSASSPEAEWRAGLDELISTLARDLTEALDAARDQALGAVRSIEERGGQLFAALDEERSALDDERTAEQAAREERVATLQDDIEAVEDEIRQTREEADRDAESTRASARRRADSIIAEAEARADAIIAEARERAAAARTGDAAAQVASHESARDVQGRLRGLSDRVGRLLSTPTSGAAAAGGVAAGAAAASAAPTPPPAPSSPPPVVPTQQPSPPAPAPVAPVQQLASLDPDNEYDEGQEPAPVPSPTPLHEQSGVAAPVQPSSPASSSWFKDDVQDDAEDADLPDDAVTDQVPASPSWSPSDALRLADSEDDEDEDEEQAAPTQIRAVTPVPEAAVPAPAPAAEAVAAGPAGAVTQTLIFQAVPNFQAALALERSLKAMSEVREVRVADFDERQLTFQVTHELGNQLAQVLLTQRGSDLELVDSRTERVEFVFRS